LISIYFLFAKRNSQRWLDFYSHNSANPYQQQESHQSSAYH
jgi:hypothetical protein